MKIAVLGGGVIGVTTAYYLAKAGHDVTVIDRQHGPALETSFANAGEVSPGYSSPWAAPGIPVKAMKWLFMEHAPLILRPHFDFAMMSWLIRLLRNCTAARYALNKSRMIRLAEYSHECLIALRSETGISYDERTQGTLQLFRTTKQLDDTSKDIEVLRADGVAFEILDVDGCVAAEPALAKAREKIVGGLRLPNDETGDCYKFTASLAKLSDAEGVKFYFGRTILGIRTERDRVIAIETSAGPVDADAFVLALGSYSPQILNPIGISIPVYPVKGYSLTTQISDESRAPVSTVMDETYKVAITRLGDRIRVGGMAEISGYNNHLPHERRATLEHSVSDLFGGAGNVHTASLWSGLRPMTPDGTPIVGGTNYRNLFLNTGHGTLGWTMACGSAKVISDLVSNHATDIDISDLSMKRYA